MKKSFWGLLVLPAAAVILTGCYSTYAEDGPPETLPPAPSTPLPPESIPDEERATTCYLVDEEDVPELGMQLPRELTTQEKEKVIQIALSTETVSELINKGYEYRTELIWMSFRSNGSIPWNYQRAGNISETTEIDPDINYFPASRIGLGSPQEFEVDVAVDLNTGKPVFVTRRPDKHIAAPSYLHYLTEEEKARMITIASETESVKKYAGESHASGFHWVALSEGDMAFSLGYDIVERGIAVDRYIDIEAKSMNIYPAAVFKSGNWKVSIAVDLETEKVVYEFRYPVR